MIEMHRILTGRYDPEVSNFIKVNTETSGTRGHRYKIYTLYNIQGKKSTQHQKILVRPQISRHVEQPQSVVSAPSTKPFEGCLDKLWQDQPITFDYLRSQP